MTITFGGKPIPKSPFTVKINPAFDASKVKVTGPGIKPTGVKSMQPTYFEVDASEAGEGNVDIKIEPVGESRCLIEVQMCTYHFTSVITFEAFCGRTVPVQV